MKPRVFIDELKNKGVEIVNASKHYKLYYNGKQTTCPRHPTREISPEMVKRIKSQLGLK